eukprot:SAG31_NODE_2251_length_6082_cov_2.050643_7_plen_98_part_00
MHLSGRGRGFAIVREMTKLATPEASWSAILTLSYHITGEKIFFLDRDVIHAAVSERGTSATFAPLLFSVVFEKVLFHIPIFRRSANCWSTLPVRLSA